ncbi:hypothetical protein N0V88_005165 [Collariella sp. IMI 366227]|nr:hypothetical protein N0V88_005165 [Collariella sp. IMI 366227]
MQPFKSLQTLVALATALVRAQDNTVTVTDAATSSVSIFSVSGCPAVVSTTDICSTRFGFFVIQQRERVRVVFQPRAQLDLFKHDGE